MSIDNEILYMPCPCGSGSKFMFCCRPEYRHVFDGSMTRAEIVQSVRCDPMYGGPLLTIRNGERAESFMMAVPDRKKRD